MTAAEQTEERTWDGTSTIPPEQWGRDWWSTFAYLGHCVHKSGGHPDRDKMRCKPGNPKIGLTMALLAAAKGGKPRGYPSRMSDGGALYDHDDYDCARDAEAAGLLVDHGTGFPPCYELTGVGLLVWSYVCRTRATDGAMDSLTVTELRSALGVELVDGVFQRRGRTIPTEDQP